LLISLNLHSIIAVCETWLNESVTDGMITNGLPFVVHRLDRNSTGGGVLLLVPSYIHSFRSHLELSTRISSLVVDLISGGVSIRVIVIYRPPNSNANHCRQLVDFIDDAIGSCPSNVVVVGDFNLSQSCQRKRHYDDLFLQHSLVQLVSKPTHGDQILDLVLCDNPMLVNNVKCDPPFSSSDHNMVLFSLDFVYSIPFCVPVGPNFRKANYVAMNHYFANFDWESHFDGFQSIDDLYSRFRCVVFEQFARFVPLNYSRKEPYDGFPWYIKKMYKRRCSLFHKLHIPGVLREFEILSNTLLRKTRWIVKSREAKVIKNMCDNSLFQWVKNKLASSTNDYPITSCTQPIVNDEEKANLFAEYFSSVFTTHNGTLPNVSFEPSCNLANFLITPDIVISVSKSLNPSTNPTTDACLLAQFELYAAGDAYSSNGAMTQKIF
jgi:hypothetical protein